MFVKQGDQISVIESAEFNKKLLKGNYLVKRNEMTGEFYLSPMDKFTFPDKVYGNPQAYVDRYLNTFNDRKGNLGVLLGGVKGTGKSLLAKMICNQSNLPVIVITEAYGGSAFKQFLSKIRQECVVFMDEFEKTYKNNEQQQQLLSVLDGVFEGKKLFLLTANTMNVSEFLTNRTGRIYYSREYTGLSKDVINEVIDDILVNKDNKELLLRDLMTVGEINMDILVAIITEMNRYDETSTKSLSFLNIFPEDVFYTITGRVSSRELIPDPVLRSNGKVDYQLESNFKANKVKAESTFVGSPLSELSYGNINIELREVDTKGYVEIYWKTEDVNVEINGDSIRFTHKSGDFVSYKPLIKKTKNKVSSDSFINKEVKTNKADNRNQLRLESQPLSDMANAKSW